MFDILSADQAIFVGRIIGGLFLLFGVVGLLYILVSNTNSKPKKEKPVKQKKSKRGKEESIVPVEDFSFSKIQTFDENESSKSKGKRRFGRKDKSALSYEPPAPAQETTESEFAVYENTQAPRRFQASPEEVSHPDSEPLNPHSFDPVPLNSIQPESFPPAASPAPAPLNTAPQTPAPAPLRSLRSPSVAQGGALPSRPGGSLFQPRPPLEDSEGFIPRRQRRAEQRGDSR